MESNKIVIGKSINDMPIFSNVCFIQTLVQPSLQGFYRIALKIKDDIKKDILSFYFTWQRLRAQVEVNV